MWIFGYGSLTWKVDFPYNHKEVGFIKGYVRRFWQGSEDHRGIPGKPGRVVTLVPTHNAQECVWGVAYQIEDKDVATVCSHLDYREKGGYRRTEVTFYPKNESVSPFNLTIYVGDTTNPFFLGPSEHEEIAKQICVAEGPSGKNSDYLFQLAETMRALAPGVSDDHLFSLEASVKKILEISGIQIDGKKI